MSANLGVSSYSGEQEEAKADEKDVGETWARDLSYVFPSRGTDWAGRASLRLATPVKEGKGRKEIGARKTLQKDRPTDLRFSSKGTNWANASEKSN